MAAHRALHYWRHVLRYGGFRDEHDRSQTGDDFLDDEILAEFTGEKPKTVPAPPTRRLSSCAARVRAAEAARTRSGALVLKSVISGEASACWMGWIDWGAGSGVQRLRARRRRSRHHLPGVASCATKATRKVQCASYRERASRLLRRSPSHYASRFTPSRRPPAGAPPRSFWMYQRRVLQERDAPFPLVGPHSAKSAIIPKFDTTNDDMISVQKRSSRTS